jgi:hypothetical protein
MVLDSKNVSEATIKQVCAGLRLRKWLAALVKALLSGLTVAAGGTVLLILGWGSVKAVETAGIMATLAGALIFYPRRKLQPAEAGLFLDLRFGLCERMCALAGLDKSSSIFASALREDAANAIKEIPRREWLPGLLPPYAKWLSLPGAMIVVLGLLGTETKVEKKTSGNTEIQLAVPVQKEKTGGVLRQLAEQYEAARKKFEISGAEKDRLEMERLRGLLETELAKSSPNGKKEQAGGTASAQKTGAQAVELVLEAKTGGGGQATENAGLVSQNPDWAAFAELAERIPPEKLAGVREYLNRLALAKHVERTQ